MGRSFELVLVRHGETDSNRTKIIQGHLDTPLSKVGEEQAALVAAHLSATTFHLCLSSDLRRAAATGEAIVAARTGNPPLERWEVARERSFGACEGRPAETLQELVAAAKGRGGLLDWGPEGGETGRQFRERVRRCLEEVCTRVEGMEEERPTVLLTTHGGFIREFNNLLVAEHGCRMPGKAGLHERICPNTGVNRYTVEVAGARVAAVACSLLHHREHLGARVGEEPVLYGV